MDDRQMKAQDLALRGHNIVITGQGGTGRTFLIKQLCKDLSKKGTSYAVTSTAGLGATLFGRATTIHKFIGFEDGRHQNNQLLYLIQTDERFLTAKSNILNTDVLIIDEVSMLSSKVLKQIEYVCRGVRKKEKYFGGMQVVLS
ncbi:hypothetical protein FSP39_023054 [Pinctada imbricata]|uniref:ATP-dependent DNA helicase n=1 Tax=Pinctada imbricata TaxID=66713 RepID=A0AA88XNQ8_PINIB|nr:hypothetical protein FSP39_023054 [Pinctada imbricata]